MQLIDVFMEKFHCVDETRVQYDQVIFFNLPQVQINSRSQKHLFSGKKWGKQVSFSYLPKYGFNWKIIQINFDDLQIFYRDNH